MDHKQESMRSDSTILVACREAPEYLPPVLSLLSILSDLGERVLLVTNFTGASTRSYLEARGIQVVEAMGEASGGWAMRSGLVKMRAWAKYKDTFWKALGEFDRPPKLWIATADTALAIGRRILKHRYVLGLLELYDRKRIYRLLLTPYIQEAAHVVTPEKTRSAIFRVWYGLEYLPSVLPNKPYGLSCYRRMPVKDPVLRAQLSQLGDRKLILYQAIRVRMDTIDVAEAIHTELGDEYVLGILGAIRDREVFSRLVSTYPDVMHFKFIPSPCHLEVTSYAHIGLLVYNYESLNNVFCAPNKVWEYGALGLPMLCNELPMLSADLAMYRAGESYTPGDRKSIAKAIRTIDGQYETYCRGSKALFDSVDSREIVQAVMERAYS
jgi:hypothetical protein